MKNHTEVRPNMMGDLRVAFAKTSTLHKLLQAKLITKEEMLSERGGMAKLTSTFTFHDVPKSLGEELCRHPLISTGEVAYFTSSYAPSTHRQFTIHFEPSEDDDGKLYIDVTFSLLASLGVEVAT